jgi:hypothetical protein
MHLKQSSSGAVLRTAQVAARYGVTVRSVDRWEEDPELQFPKPFVINTRRYWNLADLEIWERQRPVAA